MRIEYFHTITIKLPRNFTIRIILQSLLRSNINKKSLILQYSQFIFEYRNHLNKFFAFYSEFLVHDDIFDYYVSEIISTRV